MMIQKYLKNYIICIMSWNILVWIKNIWIWIRFMICHDKISADKWIVDSWIRYLIIRQTSVWGCNHWQYTCDHSWRLCYSQTCAANYFIGKPAYEKRLLPKWHQGCIWHKFRHRCRIAKWKSFRKPSNNGKEVQNELQELEWDSIIL